MGRPRLYESDSAKLQAFRQRLDSSGFVRKEAMVKTETLAEITRLAKEHGVPEADVTGSLVELGLRAWQQACFQGGTANSLESEGIAAQVAASGAVRAAWGGSAQPQASLSAASGSGNPITQFFAQRKAAHHAAQPQQPEPLPSKPGARPADKPTDELAGNSGGDPC